jgi:hypothetical protein
VKSANRRTTFLPPAGAVEAGTATAMMGTTRSIAAFREIPMFTNRLSTLPPTIAVIFGLLLTLSGAREAAAQGAEAWVLSNDSLIKIDTANPSAAGTPVAITGLNAGDTLVGIDFRPINGYLYGLGFNSVAGTVQLYNISFRTALATPIGASGTFVAADGTTPVVITGTGFGFDFIPTVDRIRVVSDSGHNFRMNPNNGAFVDGDLGGAPGSVPGLNMDGAINGLVTGAGGAAYTTNVVGFTFTTLYTLNAVTKSLYIQNPPNGGTATTNVGVLFNGILLDFEAANGFDIPPDATGSATPNAPSVGPGLAVLRVGGTTSLYSIGLTTGIASLLGPIGTGASPVQGFAIQAVRSPTQCGVPTMVLRESNAVQPLNTLYCGASGFDSPAAVSGLVAGESLVAIDFRPQTGQLYGLGFNASSGSGSATLYLIDPKTGAATIIGAASGVANGSGTPIDLTGAVAFGFDFNPTVDRIRVVTSNGLNFRLNPNDGTVVGGALDPAINGLPAGSQGLVGAAYTNSFGQPLTGGVTTLYTLDPGSNRLFIQNPANAGTQTVGVPVTENGRPIDFDHVVAFDIAPAVSVSASNAPSAGAAHAVLGFGPTCCATAALRYMIDLTTGVASPIVGLTVGGVKYIGLAVGDGPRNPTTLAVASSAPAAAVGQPVTFTATISPPNEVGASVSPNHATGTIAFTFGGVPDPGCGAQPITGMTATCTTSFVVPGSVQVAASFAGDSIHRGSTSTALTQTIAMAASTTSLTVTPNPAQVGDVITATATVNPAWATGTVAFRLNGHVVATAAVSGGTASATIDVPITANLVQASYSGAALVTPSESAPVTVTVAAAGPLTQHFAEGATGFMQTDIGIFNANSASPAVVNVKLLPEAGDPVQLVFPLEGLERRSIDVNALVHSLLVPDQGFSILVESTEPVAATRQMTWGNPVYGSTLESGIPSTSPTWYFAEGATNIFSLYYMVENPNATPANVVLTHLLEGGAAPVSHSDVIPPLTRRTFYINGVPGLESAALSTIVSSDVPVVAERAMYLNTTNRLWEGGAAGRGATAPSRSWSFAEGATGFFHTYLCLGNPNDGAAFVQVRYQLSSGETLTKGYNVAGKSRLTIDVNNEDAKLASAEVGMTIASGQQIVAERAMWWGGQPWSEGSVAIGSTATGTVWAIGEGGEGGPSGESTFVQVSNGSVTQGALRFTVAYDDGTREMREYTLVGSARLTVRIAANDFPKAVNRKFSVLVESLTFGVPITVEYARYQSPGSFGDGGGAALATRIR